MRVLRAAGYRHMPWKNGGGETAEIAIAPSDASIENFDWRISMARIASDGPFSSFPAVDRTLTIIDGAGLHLVVDGKRVDLRDHSEPFSFRGESKTHATRIGGTVTDLNVMTRRDRFTHRVTHMAPDCELVVARDVSVALLFCARGRIRIESARQAEDLSSHDSVLVREPLSLSADASADALFIEISPSPEAQQ
jgi:uncharacterized protein